MSEGGFFERGAAHAAAGEFHVKEIADEKRRHREVAILEDRRFQLARSEGASARAIAVEEGAIFKTGVREVEVRKNACGEPAAIPVARSQFAADKAGIGCRAVFETCRLQRQIIKQDARKVGVISLIGLTQRQVDSVGLWIEHLDNISRRIDRDQRWYQA